MAPDLVLTSAACVEDVQNLYVIAGYEKYIEDQVTNDECVETMLKKVVHICVPKAYDLNYDDLDKWANYDIAVIKVESNIVGDEGYITHCSYAPTVIDINYDAKELQEDGSEAMALGWGHIRYWRQENDTTNYNQQLLQYGATKIYNKKKCLKDYEMYKMDLVIKKYMICTSGLASFNDEGEIIKHANITRKNGGENETASTDNNSTSPHDDVGICQNDHGGPLVSWVRGKPVVIGVASAFKVKDRECTGPFLFTSTYCSTNFLRCVVAAFESEEEGENTRRSMPEFCYQPAEERGFDIIQRAISWADHPDGPAENEQIKTRPQLLLFDAK
ncbi:unnamed protein product [Arctia plantaginis]|uniref:Peptidase S1 domain-containing protein n=1 Tax=Arctia plantaginis TaxID=874455 RepID=A0A8S1BGD6_ARCPL|nr:unnamed protein product [Arctia plantaginis]CAB3258340.1 unnamed protein product [Arctia plantaginis]